MGMHFVCSSKPASTTSRLMCTRVMCVRKIKYKTPSWVWDQYVRYVRLVNSSTMVVRLIEWATKLSNGHTTHWVGSVAQGYSAPGLSPIWIDHRHSRCW